MITKEEIIDILKMYSGYVDRSCSDKAVHEDNFDAVAYEIESKFHQPTVISEVCDFCHKNIHESNAMTICDGCSQSMP